MTTKAPTKSKVKMVDHDPPPDFTKPLERKSARRQRKADLLATECTGLAAIAADEAAADEAAADEADDFDTMMEALEVHFHMVTCADHTPQERAEACMQARAAYLQFAMGGELEGENRVNSPTSYAVH
jgi:hypothetical protein